MRQIAIYETTLRDGLQGEGMHLSVEDKLAITQLLDELGVAYIEGGFPGSNPRDTAYFEKAAKLTFSSAKLTAFGSTRRARVRCEDDANLKALLAAKSEAVTIFGKAWKFQVTHALGISPQENLDLIGESVRYLSSRLGEVIFDAEHFFDGYCEDAAYALSVLKTAQEAGASYLVLCDTNGGTLTQDLIECIEAVQREIDHPLGIHTHNDAEMAVANSVAAVKVGAGMVQGTINGYGERCGNANLISIIPALEIKLGLRCLPEGKLHELTHVAHTVDETLNRIPQPSQPYVGRSAFAHKGGVHASAVMKDRRTYEHIDPEMVGNQNSILISDLSGRASLCHKAQQLGVELDPNDEAVQRILERIKYLEHKGYQFEGADASLKLMMDEALGKRPAYFTLHDLDVHVDITNRAHGDLQKLEESTIARIKLEVGGVVAEARAEGNGPVHALDKTLRKLIDKFYPSLREVSLLDYKVRVLASLEGTASYVRVLIESGDGTEEWNTVGVSYNIIEASWNALVDALEYKLIRDGVEPFE